MIRRVRSRQIEMTWRCSTCGHANRGRDLSCGGCGDPKDESEAYEMPADTASASTVTDPELLRVAKGGPNWPCPYCGGDARRPDGTCSHCGSVNTATLPRVDRPLRPSSTRGDQIFERSWAAFAVVAAIVLVAALFYALRTRTYDATVTSVRWTHEIIVERYQIRSHEGWHDNLGPDAFGIEFIGTRIHHHDQVFDGYDVESYTVSVACGQDCSPVPEVCSESCSPNGNGFATCRTACSGGGQSCVTRYCDEWRTRDVPRYRSVPRYADWVRYRIWEWGYARTLQASGESTDDLRWPDVEVQIDPDADGEREREYRKAKYEATLAYDDDDRISIALDPDAFGNFAVGTQHVLEKGIGTLRVDGASVVRASEDP